MSTCPSRLGTVKGMPDTGSQHLGFDLLNIEHRHDLFDQIHPLLADIIQAAHKRANHGGTGLGSEQRLVQRETQRLINFYTVVR